MRTSICPECKEEIDETNLDVGDLFDCDNCEFELEVMAVNPLVVTYSDAIYEDYDDDDN